LVGPPGWHWATTDRPLDTGQLAVVELDGTRLAYAAAAPDLPPALAAVALASAVER